MQTHNNTDIEVLSILSRDKVELSQWLMNIGLIPVMLQETISAYGGIMHDSATNWECAIDLPSLSIKYSIELPLLPFIFTSLVIKSKRSKSLAMLIIAKFLMIFFSKQCLLRKGLVKQMVNRVTNKNFEILVEISRQKKDDSLNSVQASF